jgi:predicted metal-binding membrane protein
MMPLRAARNHPLVVTGIFTTAGLAWWWTVQRMAGMDAGPGTDLGTLGWFTGSWVVMMAAMMLPSFAPTLAAYATLAHRGEPGRWLLFACGYLLAWTAAGLVAYGFFELGKGLLAGDLAWHDGGRWVSSGVLALAAAYQFTPLKHAYLTRCRQQLGDPHRASRQGWPDALSMGLRNGSWCIGCSWALMAALFALGVMSLTWMAVIAVLVAIEKTGPWPFAAKLATATVLAALAAGILAAPQQVPGLVVPDSGGMHAMHAMS